ncbi:hypothetical protein EVAR_44444_1 [Eumeta japonica]|uniref:Uncharacterized protein n=1 Tax=Eumeta variegata TaxID=151549 RepID=A0A4C1WMD3_EUMVA|nr:hypothetical protein EVAR_44444_1 [Eumeta japonica]
MLKIERVYRVRRKWSAGFPLFVPRDMLWGLLDEDPLRAFDLHCELLVKFKGSVINKEFLKFHHACPPVCRSACLSAGYLRETVIRHGGTPPKFRHKVKTCRGLRGVTVDKNDTSLAVHHPSSGIRLKRAEDCVALQWIKMIRR